jgi:hypothetical protein
MDIPEMAAEPEFATEQEEQPEDYEDEECIMLRRLDLLHFQDTLADIQSQIRDIRSQFADFQRDTCQDRLEVQEMF